MNNTLVDVPAQRPALVTETLTTLKRYDVSVIKDLEDYLKVQCQENFSDVNANLALLKLYELSSEALTEEREESTINILLLGLANFYNIDFELYLHLLPVHVLSEVANLKNQDATVAQFCDSVTKIKDLYLLLTSAKFVAFWSLLRNEDAYQDLILNSSLSNTFENTLRLLILNLIYKGYTNNNSQIRSKISSALLQNYLNIYDGDFTKYIGSQKAFKISGDYVLINEEADYIKNPEDSADSRISTTNTTNPIISSENIKLDQLTRLIKESLEQ